jgi:PadR family transcriptional regulator, activator of gas vesicle formation
VVRPGRTTFQRDSTTFESRSTAHCPSAVFGSTRRWSNLEELLLLLVTLHDGTHGKELLSDLSRLFETQLSPGTVYPCLHDLEDEDVLSMHAKVRTKEYSVADTEYVRETVEQTMVQHLAFGLLLYEFLPELRSEQ